MAEISSPGSEERVRLPSKMWAEEQHLQPGCYLCFALLPHPAAAGAAWGGCEDGDPAQQRSLACRVAQGVRSCFVEAEQGSDSSHMGLVPFWTTEGEEVLKGTMGWRPVQVL